MLAANREHISRRAGLNVQVKKALVRDPDKVRQVDYPLSLTTEAKDIIEDPDIGLVVELMGGQEPAFSYIMQALRNKKHVVTANKDLLASRGKELFAAAKNAGVDIYFEASVGGGIPIIRPLKDCLAGNKIQKVYGIVNGTTNYILTQMERDCSYEDALKQAQEKGFAEADPSADVLGLDAGRKIAILASIAFGTRVKDSDVSCVGIDDLEPLDLSYARELGYKIKLLALAQEIDGAVDVRVQPALLPAQHPLSFVDGVLNAVVVQGDAVGEVVFSGQGAGRLATASAVVGDIIEVAHNIKNGVQGRNGCTCYEVKPLASPEEIYSSYFVRLEVQDKPGVMAKVATVFGEANVSLWSVIQKRQTSRGAEIVIVTHPAQGRSFTKALDTLRGLPEIFTVHQPMTVEGDGPYVAGHH